MRFSRYALLAASSAIQTHGLFHASESRMKLFFFHLAAACSPTLTRSTIGRLGLNRRVRDGYGCSPQAHRHQNSFESFDNSTAKHGFPTRPFP